MNRLDYEANIMTFAEMTLGYRYDIKFQNKTHWLNAHIMHCQREKKVPKRLVLRAFTVYTKLLLFVFFNSVDSIEKHPIKKS